MLFFSIMSQISLALLHQQLIAWGDTFSPESLSGGKESFCAPACGSPCVFGFPNALGFSSDDLFSADDRREGLSCAKSLPALIYTPLGGGVWLRTPPWTGADVHPPGRGRIRRCGGGRSHQKGASSTQAVAASKTSDSTLKAGLLSTKSGVP